MEVYRAMRFVVPDPLVLFISILALVYISRRRRHHHHDPSNHNVDNDESTQDGTDGGDASTGFIRPIDPPGTSVTRPVATVGFPNIWMLNLLSVILVAAAGVIVPSLLSAFYLVSFYITCTYWSSCKTVYSHKLAWTRIVLLIYSALHSCLLYLYQFEFAQRILQDDSFIAR